jgi:hypothetical protein
VSTKVNSAEISVTEIVVGSYEKVSICKKDDFEDSDAPVLAPDTVLCQSHAPEMYKRKEENGGAQSTQSWKAYRSALNDGKLVRVRANHRSWDDSPALLLGTITRLKQFKERKNPVRLGPDPSTAN